MPAPSTGRPLKNPQTIKSVSGKQYQKCSRHSMAKSFPWMQLMIATDVELRPAGSSPRVLSVQLESVPKSDSPTLVRNAEIIHVRDYRMSSS